MCVHVCDMNMCEYVFVSWCVCACVQVCMYVRMVLPVCAPKVIEYWYLKQDDCIWIQNALTYPPPTAVLLCCSSAKHHCTVHFETDCCPSPSAPSPSGGGEGAREVLVRGREGSILLHCCHRC